MEREESIEEEYLLERRQKEGHFYKIINDRLIIQRQPQRKQMEFKKKIKFSVDDYTFLQYLPLIFEWITRTKKISQRDLNSLIYLQPLIVFTHAQFMRAQKQLGYADFTSWQRMKTEGWVSVYSQKGRRKHWCLSVKSSNLITLFYKTVMMEKPFPLDYRFNALVERYEVKQDKVVMDSLLEFNKRVQEKRENKT